jgi:hypothetical protein
MASRSRTRRLWILSIAGGSALLVVGGFAASWPLLLARYRCQRLDQASTFAEAKPWLDLLTADAGDGGAGSEALLSSLGGSRQRLMAWFFQGVADRALPAGIVRSFAARIESDEVLLAAWSHYVRWALGSETWRYLSGLCRANPETLAASFPCHTPVNTIHVHDAQVAQVMSVTAVRIAEDPSKQVERLALAWFLGMTPLPRLDEDIEARLSAWLAGARPFLRHLVYDEALGRCKRDAEFEPLPNLTPFPERGLPLPQAPLPGWTGPPPSRPSMGIGETPGN